MTQVQAIEAKRQEDLAVAASVAPLVLGESFAGEMPEHLEDDLSAGFAELAEAIIAQERREQAPLQPSGHVVKETEVGFVPMRRAS